MARRERDRETLAFVAVARLALAGLFAATAFFDATDLLAAVAFRFAVAGFALEAAVVFFAVGFLFAVLVFFFAGFALLLEACDIANELGRDAPECADFCHAACAAVQRTSMKVTRRKCWGLAIVPATGGAPPGRRLWKTLPVSVFSAG